MRKEIENRMFQWINRVIDLTEELENKPSLRIISGQLIRSSTSTGANYRASGRAKSLADMINKLKISEEESDESIYWLKLIEFRTNRDLTSLINEGREFLAIIVSSINTLKKKNQKKS